ncbi:uncharacterized protein C8Q71DRAFT_384822 [Rhodofomes roseus]|uniref:AB hydrolase-1 domain-containing protein n=1 Tax=Rhodofomes roseus TaxID=34475 RepID=A0ABQ8K1B1_9APHY|nr:uncharacterized protein C8Q71DRAFT_384822 [Rhodofomes roseus]KAH9829969.1 hypothetical protein C8Q71DRAFT_384822 [Rhodofomes roseus]
MPALEVGPSKSTFTYTDSGVPLSHSNVPYITVFVVHGILFNNLIFKRLQSIAPPANLRIVAINRRGYRGSTPVSEESAKLLTTGTAEEKLRTSDELCKEILYFADAFIQTEGVPPILNDRHGGGIALLGWSAGNSYVTRAIADIANYPPEMQARLAKYVRALIMEDPPSLALGLPLPEETWSYSHLTSLPKDKRDAFNVQWLTAYFEHGDLSSRDKSVIEYILPSSSRTPTLYNMTLEERAAMIEPVADSELPFMLGMFPSALAAYRKACFDRGVRALLPEMKVWHLGCGAAPSYGIAAYFDLLVDHETHGGGLINFKMIPGANHFLHWDDPEKTLQVIVDMVQ